MTQDTSMQIRVADLPEEGVRLAGTVASRDEDNDVGPIAFALHVIADGGGARVSGWLHAVVHTRCSRCAKDARLPVHQTLELEFRRAAEAPRDDDLELDEADLAVEYYAEDGIDLRAVLAAQVTLGIPMKVLCNEDCRGLCAQCGTDLNREPCDCEPPPDPRLAALADLRDRL